MNNNLEYLLHRYAEGTITPDEQNELNQLTHRDSIIQTASHRADKVCRQRRLGISAVASLLIVAGAFHLLPSRQGITNGSAPIVAQADIPTAQPAAIDQQEPASMPAEKTEAKPANRRQATPAVVKQQEPRTAEQKNIESPAIEVTNEITPEIHHDVTPVVACNTQCSPEDVIDDIWKFLNA